MASRKNKSNDALLPSDVEALKERRRKEQEERERKYPECTKLALVGDKRRELNAFLEWLREEKKIELGDMEAVERTGAIYPVRYGLDGYDKLVLEYLEVDPVKLEEERRAMLDELQERAG